MREPLVVDSNVLISALVADARTRLLIVEMDERLVAPELIADEVKRNIHSIAPRSDLPDDLVGTFFRTLLGHVELVSPATFEESIERAATAMEGERDADAMFLAVALAEDGSVWSDDADFRSQSKVPVYTTAEVVEAVEN